MTIIATSSAILASDGALLTLQKAFSCIVFGKQPVARQRQAPSPTSAQQDQDRKAVRDWLLAIQSKHSVSPRQIAVAAGVAPATVYRALKDEGDFTMSLSVASKIARTFGEMSPLSAGSNSLAMSEPDLVPCSPAELAAHWGSGLREDHTYWRVGSEALNLEGFRPGDLIEIAPEQQPERGDVVAARISSRSAAEPEIVLRVYHPPYLIPHTTDPEVDLRPTYVDGEAVTLLGTFDRLLRRRAA